MARPTKLTKELEKKILDLVAEGNFETTACLASGVEPRTYRRWKQLGKAGKKPYAEFFERAEMAAAKGEVAMVALQKFSGLGKRRFLKDGVVVEEKFEGDPKPIQWLMQRRFAKRWGNQIRLELAQDREEMLRALRENLDVQTFERVIEALGAGGDRAEDLGGLAAEFSEVPDEEAD